MPSIISTIQIEGRSDKKIPRFTNNTPNLSYNTSSIETIE